MEGDSTCTIQFAISEGLQGFIEHLDSKNQTEVASSCIFTPDKTISVQLQS